MDVSEILWFDNEKTEILIVRDTRIPDVKSYIGSIIVIRHKKLTNLSVS